MAKAHYGRALEVPYVFTDRVAGESKLNQGEIFNYLKQLGRIYGARLRGKRSRMPMPEWLRLRRATPVAADQAAQWTKCPKCSEMIYRPDLAANLWVCPRCQHHFRMHAFDRISMLVDADFTEIGGDLLPGDPLGWTDKVPYPQKLQRDREKSKLTEGVVCGFASIGGAPAAPGATDLDSHHG